MIANNTTLSDFKKISGMNGRIYNFCSQAGIDSLLVANNKIALYSCYAGLMPKQIIPESVSDVDAFASMFKYKNSSICCKVDSLCGGKGFAVVDDKKCNDTSLFNKFGENRYISLLDLKSIVDNGKNKVILQQRIEGLDYTVSALADKGVVTHICGYVGYMMAFGPLCMEKSSPTTWRMILSARL